MNNWDQYNSSPKTLGQTNPLNGSPIPTAGISSPNMSYTPALPVLPPTPIVVPIVATKIDQSQYGMFTGLSGIQKNPLGLPPNNINPTNSYFTPSGYPLPQSGFLQSGSPTQPGLPTQLGYSSPPNLFPNLPTGFPTVQQNMPPPPPGLPTVQKNMPSPPPGYPTVQQKMPIPVLPTTQQYMHPPVFPTVQQNIPPPPPGLPTEQKNMPSPPPGYPTVQQKMPLPVLPTTQQYMPPPVFPTVQQNIPPPPTALPTVQKNMHSPPPGYPTVQQKMPPPVLPTTQQYMPPPVFPTVQQNIPPPPPGLPTEQQKLPQENFNSTNLITPVNPRVQGQGKVNLSQPLESQIIINDPFLPKTNNLSPRGITSINTTFNNFESPNRIMQSSTNFAPQKIPGPQNFNQNITPMPQNPIYPNYNQVISNPIQPNPNISDYQQSTSNISYSNSASNPSQQSISISSSSHQSSSFISYSNSAYNPSQQSISILSNSNNAYCPNPLVREIQCKINTAKIIFNNNLHNEIAKKYGGKIDYQGNKFLLSGQNLSILNQLEFELQEKIKELTFDDDAKWKCLQDDGKYVDYQPNVNSIIEDKYQNFYPRLNSPDYVNYDLSIDLKELGGGFILELAKIGGVHRQRRKYSESNDSTIRAVKREAKGENLNENYRRNYSWMWWHESNEFRTYEPDAIFLIEQSYCEFKKKENSSVVLIQGINQKTYQLDFKKFIQYNEITKFERPIKRVELP